MRATINKKFEMQEKLVQMIKDHGKEYGIEMNYIEEDVPEFEIWNNQYEFTIEVKN